MPKIAKHNAGCSLMREPAHAQAVVTAMARAVKIPVTVKMRAGWSDAEINAPELARRMEDAGARAIAVHGRTAAQSYSGSSDWALIDRIAGSIGIPVFGSGDCTEPSSWSRLASGRVWVFWSAAAAAQSVIFHRRRVARRERPREITRQEREVLSNTSICCERTERQAPAPPVAPTRPLPPPALARHPSATQWREATTVG